MSGEGELNPKHIAGLRRGFNADPATVCFSGQFAERKPQAGGISAFPVEGGMGLVKF